MTPGPALLASLGLALAFVNGANDVSKGVATLVGSGLTDARRAIWWGTAWTAAGGLLGAVVAAAMVTTFGNGLLAPIGLAWIVTLPLSALLGIGAFLVGTRLL